MFTREDTNSALKEHFGNLAVSLLVDRNFILSPYRLKHLVIEFGYLLITDDSDKACTRFKVILPKKLFKTQKIYYFGTQDDKLILLNGQFTEEIFRSIQNDMFAMHKIDVSVFLFMLFPTEPTAARSDNHLKCSTFVISGRKRTRSATYGSVLRFL